MAPRTPQGTVTALTKAINGGDLDRAVGLYEPNAVLIAQPGVIARGTEEIRTALAGFTALRPTLTTHAQALLEFGDLALYLGRWSMRGTDPAGKEVTLGGESTDILRRQADGRWLIAIDNPWGTGLLPEK